MKKIAFHIQKGGVGKTTLAGNAAFSCSQIRKTIIVDADPQGNVTSWLLKEAPQHELADVLTGSVKLEDAIVGVAENFYVLPSFGIGGSLQAFADFKMIQQPFIFDDLCKDIQALGFRIAIFDLSPGMRILEKYVILAMDEVITPLTPEFFSLDGIEIFNAELKNINKDYRRRVRHRRIVANCINRSFRRHKVICEKFAGLDYEIFSVVQDSKIAESQIYHQTIFQYCPESKTVPEIRKLSMAIAGSR